MRYPFPKSLLGGAICLLLAACNGSSNNVTSNPTPTPAPTPVTPAPDVDIDVDSILQLDFTLPLSEMGVVSDTLSGATFDPIREEFVVLGEQGNLVFITQEGGLSAQMMIEDDIQASFTGIEFMDANQYLLSTSDSRIMLFESDEAELELVAELDFDIAAIAFDEVSGAALVIDNREPSQIVSVLQDGSTITSPLEMSLDTLDIEGLTVYDDNVIIAAVDSTEPGTVIIAADFMGDFGPAWQIEPATTSGLVLLNPEAPEFMTTNSDVNQSLTLFESERPASVPTETVLALDAAVELDVDQPSGVDYVSELEELFFITDFGEVRRGSVDGESILLFEFDEMQGSFEAISADIENSNLYVMFSDEATEQNLILTLDFEGNQLASFEIPTIDEDHLFESIDFNQNTNTLYTLTFDEGEKVLYQIQGSEVTTTILPSGYDDFLISGITVSDDNATLYFVTEEWENPETELLSAGLLVQYDLLNNNEIARYSLAVEEGGESVGVRDPSGVAINGDETRAFVTSDIDDSVLYVFELN